MGETGQDTEFLPGHERQPRLPPRRADPGLPVELLPRMGRGIRAPAGSGARLALLLALPGRPAVQRARDGEARARARRTAPAPGRCVVPSMSASPHRAQIMPVPAAVARPLWSVMIPTFNCNAFLRAALEGVLAQDPGPEAMQIEVVDDHSV